MNITEIRVKLTEDPRNKLKAYCTVTIDDAFVVRDLKVIEGNRGHFVAMPSRKLADRCPRCGGKNHLRAAYCNGCGGRLDPERAPRDARGRARLHADLAHPIHRDCRRELHEVVVAAFLAEQERSKQDGYTPTSFDDLDEFEDVYDEDYIQELLRPRAGQGGTRSEGGAAEGSGEQAAAEG